MKKSLINIASSILIALSVFVISSCSSNTAVEETKTAEQTQPGQKPAEMKHIFESNWGETEVNGEFDISVTLDDKEYHITATAQNYHEYDISLDYELTINDASVIYNTGEYYNINDVYLADINPDDDSVILFILPWWENGYKSITAYKYSPTSGIVNLNFDIVGNGELQPVLEPGRHCDDFKVSDDGTFALVTGSRTLGMWGLQRYFYLDENDVLVFEQQDKYEIKGWADGVNMLQTYDRGSTEPRTMTYEEAKANMMYCIESEQEYEMLLQGYYHCKQSYDDLQEGDFFKFIYDDNNGHVMFVTSEGREGWIDVNTIGSDQNKRGKIGGFALMLAG